MQFMLWQLVIINSSLVDTVSYKILIDTQVITMKWMSIYH